MNKETAENALQKIILENCAEKGLNPADFELTYELNLLESGLYDSMGLLQLIAALEEELGIEIDLSDEDPEEFTQYGKLIDIIAKNN